MRLGSRALLAGLTALGAVTLAAGPAATMELLRGYKNPNSPRGPISIDPETRDIVQNEYLREVRMVGGQLANVELETVATALKDPWKALPKK